MKTITTLHLFAALFMLSPLGAIAQTVYTDLGAFQAATSDLTVVNFDTDAEGDPITTGTVLTDEYDSIGVQFNGFNNGNLQIGNFVPVSVPNSLNNTGGGTGGGGGFEVVFDDPSSAFGLWFGGLHPIAQFQPTLLELFSATDQSIASYIVQNEIGSDIDGNRFFGVVSAEPIAKVQVAVGSNDFVFFDDLMVGQAVPEPSTMALAMGAVGVLLGMSRFARR